MLLALCPYVNDENFLTSERLTGGAPIEALERWDIGSDTGYTSYDSVSQQVQGICEKYDYYAVWMSTENGRTQARVLACEHDMEWDGTQYLFKDGIFFAIDSSTTHTGIYYVHDSYSMAQWQRNYSNVQSRGLPCYPGVSNESNKISNGFFRAGLWWTVFSVMRRAVWTVFFNKQN